MKFDEEKLRRELPSAFQGGAMTATIVLMTARWQFDQDKALMDRAMKLLESALEFVREYGNKPLTTDIEAVLKEYKEEE